MLTELFEKYGNQKPMDLGTAVERTIPVSAVIKMMEEYHEGKVKNLDILLVSNRRELFDKFYTWLDELTQEEYEDMSLTDKCEKFFF